jgi:TonB family protein
MPEPAAHRPASAERSVSAPGLLIRVEISKGPPRAPVRRRLSRGTLFLLLGAAVAILVGWVAISVFRTEPTSAPAATDGAPNSESQSLAPAPEPSKVAPVLPAQTKPAGAKSVESELQKQPDASPLIISEVIPEVPRSARETIRGTVKVSVRVIVDKEGTVLVATADDPGPSRYFERLAIQASKKWKFAPTDSGEQRIMLVRFNFRRAGTTARADSLQ